MLTAQNSNIVLSGHNECKLCQNHGRHRCLISCFLCLLLFLPRTEPRNGEWDNCCGENCCRYHIQSEGKHAWVPKANVKKCSVSQKGYPCLFSKFNKLSYFKWRSLKFLRFESICKYMYIWTQITQAGSVGWLIEKKVILNTKYYLVSCKTTTSVKQAIDSSWHFKEKMYARKKWIDN